MNILKLNLFLGFILILLTLVPNVLAEVNLQLDVNEKFNLEESVFFTYLINSDIDSDIILMNYIDCPSAPTAPRIEKTIELKAGEVFEETFNGITITENIESQICTAYVEILSPENLKQMIGKNFSIITKPIFDFNIKINKKVFVKGEDIYLDYLSKVENPLITATLTYPEGDNEQIELPKTIKASQIGTYILEVIASKEGYKTQTIKERFGVIKKSADIKEIPPPDLENFKNKGDSRIIVWIILIILIIIVFIIYIYIFLRRKKVKV